MIELKPFAVAVTMYKNIPDGIHVNTFLWEGNAVSKAEAEGLAAQEAKQRCPEHTIHSIVSDQIIIRDNRI